jgi:uncharacterized protein YqgQ
MLLADVKKSDLKKERKEQKAHPKQLVPTKKYPDNFPDDAIDVLNAMSFTDGKDVLLLGSMSLRNQLYAGDYDAYEVIKMKGSKDLVLNRLVNKFKQIIKRLDKMENVTIGDIKAGTIEEWRVIPKDCKLVDGKIQNWNAKLMKERLLKLYKNSIIDKSEYEKSNNLLVEHPNLKEFFEAKKEIRFNIIRWTQSEILAGKKKIRGNNEITLGEALNTPTIAKLDLISYVQNNRYTDFSMIYEFWQDDTPLNPDKIEITNSLKEDIIHYDLAGKPFKVIKRVFAFAKYKNNQKFVNMLVPILNSDLGRLYSISSDIGTLKALANDGSRISFDKIVFEIDQLRARFGNIYQLPDFRHVENKLLDILTKLENPSKKSLIKYLDELEEVVDNVLNKNARPIMQKILKEFYKIYGK